MDIAVIKPPKMDTRSNHVRMKLLIFKNYIVMLVFFLQIGILTCLMYLVYWIYWQRSVYNKNKIMGISKCNLLTQPYSVFNLGLMVNNFRRDRLVFGDSLGSVKQIYCKYDAAMFSIFGKATIIFYSPQLIKQFYQKVQQGCYVKNTSIGFSASLQLYLKDGLLFAQNQLWSGHRKIFVQVFNYQYIVSKIPSMVTYFQKAIQQEINKNSSQQKIQINLKLFLSKIFGLIVIKSFFGDIQLPQIQGQNPFCFISQLFNLIGSRSFTIASFFGKRFYDMGLRKIDREIKSRYISMCAYSRNLINTAMKDFHQQQQKDVSIKHEGLISLLLREGRLREIRRQGQGNDFYTYDEFIFQLLTFFFAGTDTTTALTCSLIGEVLKSPQIQAKLRNQINQVIGSDERSINSIQVLKRLQFLNCVQKEALRTKPPAPGILLRTVVKKHNVGPFEMYPGMDSSVWVMPNHYRQQYFQEPLKFKPQRWLESTKSRPQLSFLPFSFGQRSCIGQQLSLIQSKIAIALLFNKFSSLRLLNPKYQYIFNIVYQPEQILLQATPRQFA